MGKLRLRQLDGELLEGGFESEQLSGFGLGFRV